MQFQWEQFYQTTRESEWNMCKLQIKTIVIKIISSFFVYFINREL